MTQGLCPARKAELGAQDPPPTPAGAPQHKILEQRLGRGVARSRVQAVGFGIHALAGTVSLDGSVAGLKGLNILIIVPRKFFMTEMPLKDLSAPVRCKASLESL